MSDTTLPASKATGAMRYVGDLTIAISVKDLDASLAWYADVLGFELVYRMDDMRWAEMRSPVVGVQLGLGEKDTPEVEGAVPVWGVEDIATARAYLESRGVRFDGETMEIDGFVKLATFFDPDGNGYMLSQLLGKM